MYIIMIYMLIIIIENIKLKKGLLDGIRIVFIIGLIIYYF